MSLLLQNPESRLPEGMVQRAEVLFQCILRYSYQVLSSALDADLPDSLVEKNVLATDSYCTMLLNDEIHTYEQVISGGPATYSVAQPSTFSGPLPHVK